MKEAYKWSVFVAGTSVPIVNLNHMITPIILNIHQKKEKHILKNLVDIVGNGSVMQINVVLNKKRK